MARKKQGITLKGLTIEYIKNGRMTTYRIGNMRGRPRKTSISEHEMFKNGVFYRWVDIKEIISVFKITEEEITKTMNSNGKGYTLRTS